MQSWAFQSFGPLGLGNWNYLREHAEEIATHGGSKGRCHLASAGLVFHVISLGLLCLHSTQNLTVDTVPR